MHLIFGNWFILFLFLLKECQVCASVLGLQMFVLHAVEMPIQNADNEASIGWSLQDENPTGQLCR